jgi:peptide/nickel transport system ATP-binding protein
MLTASTDPASRGEALLTAEHVTVEFPARWRATVHAVSDVTVSLLPGETLSLVGESGCGKSTLGRAVVRLQPVTAGRIWFQGTDITKLRGEPLRRTRSNLQIVFQDPIESLNPRHDVGDIVAEPLRAYRRGSTSDRRGMVDETLRQVGLSPPAVRAKRPYELSGGQCQRVSIARALMLRPQVLVCDEPVSALDVSIQAQVLNLLQDMKELYGLTLLFISHDLAVVRSVSDRIAVMYLGKLAEMADDPVDLYRQPAHPYTAMLLSSVPQPTFSGTSRPVQAAASEPPSPLSPPSGCRFRTRCPRARQLCADEEPIMRVIRPGRRAACHFPLIEPEPTPAPAVAAIPLHSAPADAE